MAWKNTRDSWGWLAISFHWLTAVTVFALYALGWYMVDLDYYSEWYRLAPFWHKSVGLLLCLLVIIRMASRLLMPSPDSLPNHQPWERLAGKLVHAALYLLLLVCFISGYFISTADGRGIEFFGLFDVPAIVSDIDNLEDLAGDIHIYATDTLIVVALLHAGAAIKHHVIDRDSTLKRMLGMSN